MENKLDYDGIIFDLDGTLWNATGPCKEAWVKGYELKGYGKIEFDDGTYKSCMGMLIPDIARKLFPNLNDDQRAELIEEIIKVEHELLKEKGGILYSNLEETLKQLSVNHKLCVVSNCQAGYIEIFLEFHGLGKYFTDIECPGNTGKLKCDNIKMVVDRNHFQKPIYVGDTKGDCDSAHKAGVPFIFASYGFGDVSDYEYKIENLLQLTQMF